MRLALRFCLLPILLVLAPGAIAQMVGGTISGDVVDASGSAVGRAEVLIRNDETGSERKFVTADSGTFSAPSVAVGVYTVSFRGWICAAESYRDWTHRWPECSTAPCAHDWQCATNRLRSRHTCRRRYLHPADAGSD